MTLERRTQALLELVAGDRDAQVGALVGDARARAAVLLREAHADALARVREVFGDERRRARESVAAARAKLQTRRRLHDQHRTAALLALAWQRLPEALRARWSDAEARGAWVAAIAATALRVLPRAHWRIVHGADWPEAERDALCARLAPELDAPPELLADPGVACGLRIAASGNVVDGTQGGLIDDRVEVGAQLLRILESPS